MELSTFTQVHWFKGITPDEVVIWLIASSDVSQQLTRTKKKWITPVLRSVNWHPVCQRIDFKILLWEPNGFVQNTFLTCCFIMNHPDLWGHQVQVCFQSLQSKLNMEKERSVILQNSQKTAGLLQLSPLCLRHFCLKQPFTEALSRLWTALSYICLLYCFWACYNVLFLDVFLPVLMSFYAILNAPVKHFKLLCVWIVLCK